jgi:hypothetical protein
MVRGESAKIKKDRLTFDSWRGRPREKKKKKGAAEQQNGLRADHRPFAQIAECNTPFRWHFRVNSTLDKELLFPCT